MAFLTVGEVVGCQFAGYPNVQQWLARMKSLKSWKQVNEALYGIAASLKDKPFVTV